MKKFRFLWFLLLSAAVFSQDNFEGIITFDGFSTIDSSKFTMKVYYGKNNMKIETFEKGSSIHENSKRIVYDLKKGIQYTIDTLFETVEIDSLKYSDAEDMNTEFLPTDTTKNILNIHCRLYNAKAKIDDSVLVVPQNNVSIWFAENIKYIIPEAYRNRRSLLTLKDGNCVWLDFTISFKSPLPRNKGATVTISNKAVLVEHKVLPESTFNIPANYRRTYRDHGSVDNIIEDSEIKTEEIEKPEPPQPAPTKKSLKPSSKKDTDEKPVKG